MKSYLTFIAASCLLLSTLTSSAQMGGGDKSKRPSPPATASGTIGSVKVVINYGAPSVKGRKVFGSLQPYGEVWRAGANEATTIEFNKPVTIQGKALPQGKYALYILLDNEKSWTLIFNKKWDQWGTNYDANKSQDVLKVSAPVKTIPLREKLQYTLISSGVALDWETKEVSFKVAAQ